MLSLTLLGTGAAGGVPLYGCHCSACEAATHDHNLERKPCSAMIEWGDEQNKKRLLIDAGIMDLHKRFSVGSYIGFLLTHFHVDHVQGLFHLRWGNGALIPVWCPNDPLGCADLLKHSGCLDFRSYLHHGVPFNVEGLKITPLSMQHSKPTFGYLFEFDGNTVAYLTDTDGLPFETEQYLLLVNKLDALVLDCSFPPALERGNHSDIDTAFDIYERLLPKQFIITHIGHELDCWLQDNQVPSSLVIGCDGHKVDLI